MGAEGRHMVRPNERMYDIENLDFIIWLSDYF